MTRAIGIPFALLLCGCSLFMRTNSVGWKPSDRPTCSDSVGPPALDTVLFAIGGGLTGVGALCFHRSRGSELRGLCGVYLTPGIAMALLYGGGALFGWHRVRTCRRAMRKHQLFLATPEGQTALEEQHREREGRRRARGGARGGGGVDTRSALR